MIALRTVLLIGFLLFLASDMQSAVGFDYQAQLAKHGSQTDAAKGFGGKYGVQKERKDKVSTYTTGICEVLYMYVCKCGRSIFHS